MWKFIFLIGIVALMVFATNNLTNADPRPSADEGTVRALITQAIDENNLVTLAGNTRPEANYKNDRGAVSDALPSSTCGSSCGAPPNWRVRSTSTSMS